MNWGGFGAGFSEGFDRGTRIGKTIRDAMNEKDRKDRIEAAKSAAAGERTTDISKMVSEGSLGAAPTDTKTKAPEPTDENPTIERQRATGSSSPAQAGATATPASEAQTATPSVQAQTVTPAMQGLSPARTLETPPQPAPTITPQQIVPGQTQDQTAPQDGPLPPPRPNLTPGQAEQTAQPQAITPQAAPQPAVPGLPEQHMPFRVGSRGFATRAEAEQYATKKVPGIADYVRNNVLKAHQDIYIENGEIEKAEKLGQMMETKKAKDATRVFGSAMTKMLAGDINGGVEDFGVYYNKYIDDGVDFKSHKIGEDGKLHITVRQKGADKDTEMVMTKSELIRLGMAHDPVALQKSLLDATEKKEAAAAEVAKEDRKFKRDIQLKGIEHGYKAQEKKGDQEFQIEKLTIDKQLEQAGATAKVKREVNAKVEALRGAGYSEQFINDAMPGIIGLGDYKKKTSPEEARRLAHSDRMKSDPTYARKAPGEQKKILDQDMTLIFGGVDPKTAPQSTTPAAPAAGGAKKGGTPYYNPLTKQTTWR